MVSPRAATALHVVVQVLEIPFCSAVLVLQSGIHVHLPHVGSELMAKPPHVVAEGRKLITVLGGCSQAPVPRPSTSRRRGQHPERFLQRISRWPGARRERDGRAGPAPEGCGLRGPGPRGRATEPAFRVGTTRYENRASAGPGPREHGEHRLRCRPRARKPWETGAMEAVASPKRTLAAATTARGAEASGRLCTPRTPPECLGAPDGGVLP